MGNQVPRESKRHCPCFRRCLHPRTQAKETSSIPDQENTGDKASTDDPTEICYATIDHTYTGSIFRTKKNPETEYASIVISSKTVTSHSFQDSSDQDYVFIN